MAPTWDNLKLLAGERDGRQLKRGVAGRQASYPKVQNFLTPLLHDRGIFAHLMHGGAFDAEAVA